MKGYLRRFGIVLVESIVILIAMSAFYTLGYLACYQTLPRWK